MKEIRQEHGSSRNIVGEISIGKRIYQRFVPIERYLKAIELEFGTYRRQNYGTMTFTIINFDKSLIETRKLDVRQFKDNEFFRVDFNIQLEIGKEYCLIISSDCRDSLAPTIKYGGSGERTFMINGDLMSGELHSAFIYESIMEDDELTELDENVVDRVVVKPEIYPNSKVKIEISPNKPKKTSNAKFVPKQIVKDLVSIIFILDRVDISWISKSLANIASQTYKDIEVVIINNNQPKAVIYETLKVLKPYRKSLNILFSTIREPEWSGGRLLDVVVKHYTKGQFILFCTPSVQLDDSCIATMVSTMKDANKDVAWAYSDFVSNGVNTQLSEFSLENIMKSPICHLTSLIDKSMYMPFGHDCSTALDWTLFLNMAKKKRIGKHIPQFLFKIGK